MKQLYLLRAPALLLALLFALTTHAQQRITGQVTSSKDNSPLPGVSVAVKGVQSGGITDVDGRFTVNAPANATLIFSFIGYVRQGRYLFTNTVTLKLLINI
jgi:hypothetical protein